MTRYLFDFKARDGDIRRPHSVLESLQATFVD